jgi:hypothetical protein
MNSLELALKEKKNGLYYGTRVILPFVVDILKAVIDDDLITDFSPISEGAYYEKFENYTEIYFFDHEDILKDVSKYETIKMIVVDDDDDICNFEHHKKISLNPEENHKLTISEMDDNVVFID